MRGCREMMACTYYCRREWHTWAVPDSSVLQLVILFVLAAGGVLGWLASRSRRDSSTSTWRDTSLDDWRREQKEQDEQNLAESNDQLEGDR